MIKKKRQKKSKTRFVSILLYENSTYQHNALRHILTYVHTCTIRARSCWPSRLELWSSHAKFNATENELEGVEVGRLSELSYSFLSLHAFSTILSRSPFSFPSLTLVRFLTCEWNTKARLNLFRKLGSFSLFWSACANVWLFPFLQTFNRHPRADN